MEALEMLRQLRTGNGATHLLGYQIHTCSPKQEISHCDNSLCPLAIGYREGKDGGTAEFASGN